MLSGAAQLSAAHLQQAAHLRRSWAPFHQLLVVGVLLGRRARALMHNNPLINDEKRKIACMEYNRPKHAVQM